MPQMAMDVIRIIYIPSTSKALRNSLSSRILWQVHSLIFNFMLGYAGS
jgi:hypothetical protein